MNQPLFSADQEYGDGLSGWEGGPDLHAEAGGTCLIHRSLAVLVSHFIQRAVAA
jgi:hypothetical protein